jgi:hypothetical protein
MKQCGKNCTAVQATDDNTIRLMRFTCWLNKARGTHSEYVTLIAFQLQNWIHERTSRLRHTYISCLVLFAIIRP